MKKATKVLLGIFTFSILISSMALAQPTIDGTSSDVNYTTLASFTSGNNGFGSSNNIDELNFYSDGTRIYIGIPGDLDSNNNIIVWFNFSGYDGQDAGSVIGESGENGVFGTGGFDGAKLDFEVDYAFAFNEGNGTSNLFLDAARYGNTGIIFESAFVGQSDQSGNSVTIPASNITNLFDASTITMAYNNAGGSDQGVEFSIDISKLPGVDSSNTLEIFVAIASSGGFLSNEFIPSGSYTGANLGDDGDVGALTGQYYTDAKLLQHNISITGDAGWRLLSLPKTGGTVADISDDSPVQGVTGGDDAGSDANFIIYDNTGSYEQPTNVSTAWGDGYGFGLYFYNNTTNGSSTLPVTLDASGAEPSSDVTINLNKSTTSGGLNHYFTLVGNPYAANYNLNSITQSGTGLQDNVHFWDDGAGSYDPEDRTASSGFIASPWQGFWAEVSNAGTSTTITFPTSGKSTSDTTKTFFSKEISNRGDIAFTLSGEESFDKAIRLSFRDYATEQIDPADATKMIPLLPSYATMAFESNDILKSVESLPYNLEEEITLSLQPQLVGVSGEFTFGWNGLETIPGEWELILHDYDTGASIDMRGQNEYVFSAGAQAKANPNPLSLLSGPAAVAMKAKAEANRFGITIRPTSVSNETEDSPAAFALEQNYPNPFNPSTTISYSVQEAGAVNISVYNLMGQKVATLVDETKAAGQYNVRWNAAGAASGMYYYRLEAGGQSITRKMTLIK